MVDVFASLDWHNLMCLLAFYMLHVRAKLRHLRIKTTLDLFSVIMLESLGLDRQDLSDMLLLGSFRVGDGLK